MALVSPSFSRIGTSGNLLRGDFAGEVLLGDLLGLLTLAQRSSPGPAVSDPKGLVEFCVLWLDIAVSEWSSFSRSKREEVVGLCGWLRWAAFEGDFWFKLVADNGDNGVAMMIEQGCWLVNDGIWSEGFSWV